VDDVNLESFKGLGMIPQAILRQSLPTVINYLLDWFRSPGDSLLFRSKIMTVGYESVGKTTLLDCLFPIMGNLLQYEGFFKNIKKTYFFVLQGKYFMKFSDKQADRKSVV